MGALSSVIFQFGFDHLVGRLLLLAHFIFEISFLEFFNGLLVVRFESVLFVSLEQVLDFIELHFGLFFELNFNLTLVEHIEVANRDVSILSLFEGFISLLSLEH